MKCPDCGKTGIKAKVLRFHRQGHNRYKNAEQNKAMSKVAGNGHADLATLREHGQKYLEARREVLLRAVDAIDAALKTLAL